GIRADGVSWFGNFTRCATAETIRVAESEEGQTMRVVTLNANGIRSAARKGFFEWLPAQQADVVCVQETKAREAQLQDAPVFYPRDYHVFYESATIKKGYSGVALYSRREPDALIRGLGFDEFDPEGRFLEARFGNLSVISLYL